MVASSLRSGNGAADLSMQCSLAVPLSASDLRFTKRVIRYYSQLQTMVAAGATKTGLSKIIAVVCGNCVSELRELNRPLRNSCITAP